jgi:hypothetical protein
MRSIAEPTLGVHDSFIVPVRAVPSLTECMAHHLKKACETIATRLPRASIPC